MRRDDELSGEKSDEDGCTVEGRRRKGRRKRRWMDSVQFYVDMREKGLSSEHVEATCDIHRPHIGVGKDIGERRRFAATNADAILNCSDVTGPHRSHYIHPSCGNESMRKDLSDILEFPE